MTVPFAAALVIGGQTLIQAWVGDASRPPTSLLALLGAWAILNAWITPIAMYLNPQH